MPYDYRLDLSVDGVSFLPAPFTIEPVARPRFDSLSASLMLSTAGTATPISLIGKGFSSWSALLAPTVALQCWFGSTVSSTVAIVSDTIMTVVPPTLGGACVSTTVPITLRVSTIGTAAPAGLEWVVPTGLQFGYRCFNVSSIQPTHVSAFADPSAQLTVTGSGLPPAAVQCVFTHAATAVQLAVTGRVVSSTQVVCSAPSLAPGNVTVTVQISSGDGTWLVAPNLSPITVEFVGPMVLTALSRTRSVYRGGSELEIFGSFSPFLSSVVTAPASAVTFLCLFGDLQPTAAVFTNVTRSSVKCTIPAYSLSTVNSGVSAVSVRVLASDSWQTYISMGAHGQQMMFYFEPEITVTRVYPGAGMVFFCILPMFYLRAGRQLELTAQ